MDNLVTVAVVVALVLAIHAAFAVYLYRSLTGSGSDTDPAVRTDTGGAAGRDGATDRETPTTVHCPTCGTPNDRRFQFCRRCVSDLSSGGNPRGSTIPSE